MDAILRKTQELGKRGAWAVQESCSESEIVKARPLVEGVGRAGGVGLG